MMGHKEQRCLKLWNGDSTYNKNIMDKFVKCIECGKKGHFKCSQESKTWKIKLDFEVKNNLDEFFSED